MKNGPSTRVEFPRRNPLEKLAAWLDRSSTGVPSLRRSYWLYRRAIPKKFTHHRHPGPRFFLTPPHPGTGARDIYFDQRLMGATAALSAARNSTRGHCFLFASGPSLKDVDLKLLQSHPLIGVNGTIAKFTEADIPPTHFFIHDEDFFEHRLPLVRDVVNSGAQCFFSAVGLSRLCEFAPDLLTRAPIHLQESVNRIYGQPQLPLHELRAKIGAEPDFFLPAQVDQRDYRIGFSRDLQKGYFPTRTVLYGALQTAYHLGYRRIFIIGMDMNYQGPGPRFNETAAQMRPTRIERDFEGYILPAFQLLKEFSAAHQFEVYNLSPASRMPETVVPRLTLQDALALTR